MTTPLPTSGAHDAPRPDDQSMDVDTSREPLPTPTPMPPAAYTKPAVPRPADPAHDTSYPPPAAAEARVHEAPSSDDYNAEHAAWRNRSQPAMSISSILNQHSSASPGAEARDAPMLSPAEAWAAQRSSPADEPLFTTTDAPTYVPPPLPRAPRTPLSSASVLPRMPNGVAHGVPRGMPPTNPPPCTQNRTGTGPLLFFG